VCAVTFIDAESVYITVGSSAFVLALLTCNIHLNAPKSSSSDGSAYGLIANVCSTLHQQTVAVAVALRRQF
jgi:hypothetical protein